MQKHSLVKLASVLLAVCLSPAILLAEVTRVEVSARYDAANGATFGSTGVYEQLVGKIFFAVDPGNPRNRVIVDLDRAPRNAAGQVEMSADFAVLRRRTHRRGTVLRCLMS